jgi:tungstate transport system permease protein
VIFEAITDPFVQDALSVSLEVSFATVLLAMVPGVMAGLALGLEKFKLRSALITLLYTSLAFPTVVIGLLVYLLLSRSGPLGSLGLLYTKTAIVIGQTILVIPIIATFTLSAINKLDPALILTSRSLGASRTQLYLTMISEARFGIIAALIASFGRAISEVGISMILGGNIAGVTRTMTTAIALEHDKGRFSEALILGLLLLIISLSINGIFHSFQGPNRDLHD